MLLEEKLTIPRLAGPIVPRPRLFAALDEATRSRITTLIAPAGSGKTTLLASWLRDTRPDQRVTWVNLDSFDNDPRVFCACLGTALHRAADDGGDGAGPAVPRTRAEDPVRELLEALYDLGRPTLLVLDNVHEIDDPRVLRGLERLLQRGPASVHVVLSGRATAGLRLGRLRLSGEVGEVTAAALAGTREETEAVLATLGEHPSAERLDTIMARTEGWLAGVRLLATPAPAGARRGVAEYLREEVLDRQPAEARALLLRTCLPDRIGVDLAEELTGDAGAGPLLDRLARDNALVTAESAGCFRYHPMLREALSEQLHRELPGQVADLRRRAAGWYAERGDTAEALRLAVAGGDWEHAARLLVDDELRLPFSGDRALAGPLLAAFPESRLTADPELAAVFAAAELAGGDPAAAEPFLHLAEHTPAGDRAVRLERCCLALRLCQSGLRGETDRTVLKAGWELMRTDGSGLELPAHRRGLALLSYHLAVATLLADEPAPARLAFAEALRLLDGTGFDRLALAARGWLALLTASAGRLTEAAGTATLTAAEERAAPDAALLTRLARALVELERGEPTAARRLLVGTRDPHDPVVAVAAGLVRARLLIDEGEPTAARAELDALRQHAPARAGWPRHAATLLHARALLAMSDPVEAAAVLDRALGEAAAPDSPDDAVVVGALRLAGDDPPAALRAVQQHVDDAAVDGEPLDEVGALLVAASAHRRLGNRQEAVRLLERALDRAAPEGLARVFVDAGADIQALLTLHIRPEGGHGAAREKLLRRFDAGGSGRAAPSRALLEPLTNSELAVLRYLPSLMVNEEIAAQMYLSVNTVKSHLRSLYRKLDVTNRRSAVARARRLGLL